MKVYRASGPFSERPFFKLQEIERICLDELLVADLLPASPEPVRIERFVEKRFGVSPVYDDLPVGVLGFTIFGRSGVEEIVVSRVLSEEGTRTAERRLNTTLAHEAGHGLLHAQLFALGPVHPSLFGSDDADDDGGNRILCREYDIGSNTTGVTQSYDGRWWEFQANRAIGGLLLPRPLVEECVASFLTRRGALGLLILDESRREEAVRAVAEVFDVNPIVARIRLNEIFVLSDNGQLTL